MSTEKQHDEIAPAYLGGGRQAFPAEVVARWPEINRARMTVKLFTADQVAAKVAAERERCAKLVEAMDTDYLRTSPCRKALERAAKAIRKA